MSGRRGGNRIRGPQSALTDFLAANNISAAQIRDDHDRRLREAEQHAPQPVAQAGPSTATQQEAGTNDQDDENEDIAATEQLIQRAQKRKRETKEAADKIKAAKKQKKKSKKPKGSDDEFDNDFGYEKSRPLPGQFEHCELCEKRFTVTPYSKEGPEGGLLCTPCGKQQTNDAKKEERALKKKPVGRKRRQNESNKLDGLIINRAKSLQQLCIEKIVQYHDDVEELGDMPPQLLDRVSMIFSKKRVMNSKTLKLFLKPKLESVAVHDAAYLEVDDYKQMFAVNPAMTSLTLRNACQLKDEAIEYMLEKCDNIRHLQLYAANLISDDMWCKLFARYGQRLHSIKLNWLDATFDDAIVAQMVSSCPNIRRLKLKLLRRIGEESINSIAELQHLEHLSLQVTREVSPEALVRLLQKVGKGLQTLSLEHFLDLDDTVLAAIHEQCTHLKKLRISKNDTATDAAYAALFTKWNNPPLEFVDLNTTRDVDNNNPTGPTQAIGLADAGFAALMKHSGSALKILDVASCRHISLSTFFDVFDGQRMYSNLDTINLSFCSCVNTVVVMGIIKSCPRRTKVIAFGCFDVEDVIVPRGMVLIGVPKAQDAIEQIGSGIGTDEAIMRMAVEAAA